MKTLFLKYFLLLSIFANAQDCPNMVDCYKTVPEKEAIYNFLNPTLCHNEFERIKSVVTTVQLYNDKEELSNQYQLVQSPTGEKAYTYNFQTKTYKESDSRYNGDLDVLPHGFIYKEKKYDELYINPERQPNAFVQTDTPSFLFAIDYTQLEHQIAVFAYFITSKGKLVGQTKENFYTEIAYDNKNRVKSVGTLTPNYIDDGKLDYYNSYFNLYSEIGYNDNNQITEVHSKYLTDTFNFPSNLQDKDYGYRYPNVWLEEEFYDYNPAQQLMGFHHITYLFPDSDSGKKSNNYDEQEAVEKLIHGQSVADFRTAQTRAVQQIVQKAFMGYDEENRLTLLVEDISQFKRDKVNQEYQKVATLAEKEYEIGYFGTNSYSVIYTETKDNTTKQTKTVFARNATNDIYQIDYFEEIHGTWLKKYQIRYDYTY